MRLKHLFSVFLMLLTVNIGSAWGADVLAYTIELQPTQSNTTAKTSSNFVSDMVTDGSSYISSCTATANAYSDVNCIKLGSSSKAGSFTLSLATSGQVKATKVVLSAKYYDSGKTIKLTANSTVETFTPTENFQDYELTLDGNSNLTTISVESVTTSKGRMYVNAIKVYVAGTACSSEVAITKGAETNGTYTLSDTKVCGDGDGGEITISDIEPADGYAFDEITATVGTVDNENKKVTGITAATTITVLFKELQKYTVSFSTGAGNPAVNAITETSGGAGITLPAGPTPACSADGWTFAGWAASSVASETTTAPTLLSGTYNPTDNVTLYAVYKRSEGAVFDGNTAGDFYIYAEISGTKHYATAFAKKLSSTTDVNSAVKFTFEKIVENEETYFAIKSGDAYLSYGTSGTDFTFTGTSQYKWQPTSGSYGTWRLIASSASGRALTFRGGTTNVFGPYATSNINGTEYYDIEIGGGTTYYLSAPSCCEKHAITIANNIENGSVTADLNEACEGAVVTLSPEAATAYHFDAWSVVDAESNAVTVTNNQFTMPATAVTVSATFVHDACTDLATPANVVADVEITAAMLEWGAVEHADKYLVYIYDNEDNEIEHATVTEAAYIVDATLSAATTYKYSIQAQSNTPAAYCDSQLKEGSFTTEDYPAASLTLSENGAEHNLAGSYHVNDVVQLPTAIQDGNECAGKVLVGWSANAECAEAPEYAKGADFTLTAVSQKLYAVYAKETAGATEYVKTALANIVSGSVVVVTGKVGDNIYAASNNNGTSAAPSVIAVTEINDKLTAGVTTNALWTLTKDGDNFSLAAGDNKMYCTATNNGVRVGTNTNNVFSIKDDYLYNNATSRYVGVYNSSDFRCYTSINSNITGQTLAFYVESSQVSYSNYSTTCAAALAQPTFSVEAGEYDEAQTIELSAAEGTIYYTLDGSNPTNESTEYTAAIALDKCGTTTIKAIAITNDNESAVASATYTIAIPIPANSQAIPYTPAQAIEVIDGGCYNDEMVYVKGVVTRLQNAFNPTYGNYELFVKEAGTDGSVEFEFYRLYKASENTKFTEDEIGVGDTLIAVGTMKKYNNVYEFNAGCYIVEHKPYFVPKTSIANTQETAYTVAQAIAFCNDALTYDLSEEVYVKGVASGAPNNQGTFNIHDADVDNSFELYKANLNELEVAENDTVIAKGHIIKYNETTYEMAQGGLIVEVKPYVAPAVAVTGVSLDLEEASIQAGKTQQLVATIAPTNATNQNVSWSSSAESVATVSDEGLVTAVAVGEATITVTTEDGNYTATCDITVTAAPVDPSATGTTYTKVTSTEDITDGEYLIVYEGDDTHDAAVFDGSLDNDNIDVAKKVLAVEIVNGEIAGNTDLDAAVFTIDVTAGSLQSASGLYIGRTANSNGMDKSTTEAYVNTFAITDGAAVITGAGGCTLRYNYASDQLRFRYYKSGQQAIQLYKKDAAEPTPVDPVYEVVRTELNNGQFYTMCLDKNVIAVDGASIWQIIGKSGNSIELGEVSGELEAGKPYFFKAEAATLKVVYGDEVAASAGTNNGLVGSFTEENITAGESNYILYDNKLYEVAAGQSAKVGANRAYVDFNAIGAVVGQSPAMRRMAMPIVRSTATGIEAIEVGAELKKVVIDGQLYIVRDGRMYDVTGQLVR